MNSVKIGGRKPRKTYHHGDLRQQLLAVAEKIILERGVDGFTLREAARRLGVSPAAPAHHFKDARGLLTEVATLGFREFGDALEKADRAAGPDVAQRLRAQGKAYVRFALEQPARFQLIFRHDKQDGENEAFLSAAKRAFSILESAIRAATQTPAPQELSNPSFGLLIATWSLVHGFSHLALGGELNMRGERGSEHILESLLPMVLQYLPKPAPDPRTK